jgi:hypothetical protein
LNDSNSAHRLPHSLLSPTLSGSVLTLEVPVASGVIATLTSLGLSSPFSTRQSQSRRGEVRICTAPIKRTMQPELISACADISRRTLCLFMDETGHDEFKSGQRFFAIGGIAGFGPQVEHATKLWREMKVKHFGDADTPLHASGQTMSGRQIGAVSKFFARSKLPRFVFIIKRPPVLPSYVNALKLLHPIMVDELARMIGDLPTLPSNVLICLKHTELLTPKIIEAMPAIVLEIHGTEVPVAGIFIHEGTSEPLLEMADHLAWRAQRQYKDQAPRKELMPEFVAVFPKGAAYAIYRELRLGKMSSGEELQWRVTFTDDDPATARPDWRARKSASGA